MAIILRAIESQADGVAKALVEHGGRELSALVAGDPHRLLGALGSSLIVEVDYKEVRWSRVLQQDEPERHGLFPAGAGDIRIVGAIHNIMATPDSAKLVDVYLRTGPEFITFEADTLAAEPQVGVGLEVVVAGLCFYPTWV